VGLKPSLSTKSTTLAHLQQSHHCGIETTEKGAKSLKQLTGSNRTIVGLKLQTHRGGLRSNLSSNRTIVGLKRRGKR